MRSVSEARRRPVRSSRSQARSRQSRVATAYFSQRLAQIDRALGRPVLDEHQLRRMPEFDLAPQLAAQKTRRVLERLHRLRRRMPVADNRHKHLRVMQILRDLHPRHCRKPHPRIVQVLRNQRSQHALHLVVDLLHPLRLHTLAPIPASRSRPTRRRTRSRVATREFTSCEFPVRRLFRENKVLKSTSCRARKSSSAPRERVRRLAASIRSHARTVTEACDLWRGSLPKRLRYFRANQDGFFKTCFRENSRSRKSTGCRFPSVFSARIAAKDRLSAKGTLRMGEFGGDGFDGVGFDDVADFKVLVAGDLEAALVAFGDFADIVFEAAERFEFAFEDDRLIAQDADFAAARDLAVFDVAAGDGADLADLEDLAHFGVSERDLAL